MSSVLKNLQYPGLENEDEVESNEHAEVNIEDDRADGTSDAECSTSPTCVTTLTPAASLTTSTAEGKDQKPVPPKRSPSVLSPYPHPQTKSNNDGAENVSKASQPESVDYGYGHGSPDTAKLKVDSAAAGTAGEGSKTFPGLNPAPGASGESDTDVYGYGSGSPDVHKTKTAHQLQQELRTAAENMDNGIGRNGSRSSNVARNPPAGAMLSSSMHNPRSTNVTHHTYDRTRVPRRSSLKSSNSGGLSTLQERRPNNGSGPPARRGVSRHHSIDCARSTMIEVRMRGERRPVQRKRSIDFSKTVQVKEVEPVTVLTEDIRDLWLQADDFVAMKEHRRSLLKKYKEAQALQEHQEMEQEQNKMSSSQHQPPSSSSSSSNSHNANTTKLSGGISFVKSCLRRSSGSHVTPEAVTAPMEVPATLSSATNAGQNPGVATTKMDSSASVNNSNNDTGSADDEDDEEPNDKYSTPFKKKIVKKVMGPDDSFRGLEKYIDKSTRRNKNIGWDAVLLEQDEQEFHGKFDEDKIANLYRQQTSECPEKAARRAEQDRAEVESYLMSPRTMKLMRRVSLG
mmetsp:Transcript_50996/g.122944  ORF Transcript_50996/g.122944 Transcript_50996/m.122944 type:complete len:569 (+) Transcript_50996:506-2212(+)|eukprot:CAMPEP_0113493826 /NCGR_PEP_ID=MMETSP0014_2-20120614/28794_1 /TAXON_ID=2857 /ORGANISM="Nitzschia sp." /LENGTH=568 /DNA_ID=CAMNT_0000387705 /DNA_START=443 /DNA_END=2149 /DNA_ORIENTATION=+ /assembly_acc=CAM_ASM_000159